LNNEQKEGEKDGTTNEKKLWPGDVTIQQRWKSAEETDRAVQLYTHPGFPYRHYIHHFTTSSSSSSRSKNFRNGDDVEIKQQQQDLTPQRFFDVYEYLLKIAGINNSGNVEDEEGGGSNSKETDSYNLGFTKDWIVIAKRVKESVYPVKEGTMVNLHEEKDKGKGKEEEKTTIGISELAHGSQDHNQDGDRNNKQDEIRENKKDAEMVPIPGLSVNGTILGGMILTRTEVELKKLMKCDDEEWKRLFGGLGDGEQERGSGGWKDDSRL